MNNQFIIHAVKIFISLALLSAISACDSNNTDTKATNNTTSEVPGDLHKLTLPGGNTLRAYVSVDGGARIEMTIDPTGAGSASASIPNLSLASHTVTITYEYTDSTGTIVLATATNTVDLSSGSGSLSFVAADYDFDSHDTDGDGINNVAELAAGKNPHGQPAFPIHCFPFDVTHSYGDMAFDYDGNLLIAENSGMSIRVLNPISCDVTTLSNPADNMISVVEDKIRNKVYAGSTTGVIYDIDPDNGTSTTLVSTGSGYINSLVRAPSNYGSFAGQLIAGTSSGEVLAIDQSQASPTPVLIATVSGSTVSDMVFGADGSLYVTDYNGNKVVTVAADGTLTDFVTGLNSPEGLEVDVVASRLFIAASGAPATLYEAAIPSGTLTPLRTMNFGGGFGTTGLAYDSNGMLLMHVSSNQIVAQPVALPVMDTSCLPLAVSESYGDIVFTANGDLLVPNASSDEILRIARATCTSSVVTNITGSHPISVAEDTVRNRLYAGSGNVLGNIYEINPDTGASSLLINIGTADVNSIVIAPASYGIFAGQLIIASSDDNVYALDQSLTSPTLQSIANIGSVPSDLVFGSDGTLYIADYNGDKVVTLASDGTLTDFAITGINGPDGLEIDNTGRQLFIANSSGTNSVSSATIPSGTVTSLQSYSFGGGYYPSGIAFDGYASIAMHLGNSTVNAHGLYPVTYGADTQLPDTASFGANFLLGHQITVDASMSVSSLGNWFITADSNAKFALYSDDSGRPGTLLMSTASFATSAGKNTISTTSSTRIAAGDYWLMGVYDAVQSSSRDLSGSEDIHYISHTFANAFPATWPVSDTQYTGNTFNYFIEGGALSP